MENDHVGRILCRQLKRQPGCPFSEAQGSCGTPPGKGRWLHIAKCNLHAVCRTHVPSCFSSDLPGDMEKGLEWQPDSFIPFWSSQGLRLGMWRKDWLISELWKAVISFPWDSRLDATRGADNAAGFRAALVLYFSSPSPGERSVNIPECEY